ncbi:peptidylprolyl isomerase [Candidatus Providencia siddallii]|uniref:Periplasmic chaperone PpiD n=1 Tax=Candidatus Providencia siddallii TaxID=1715285 RepID=A0ABP1CE12_9GAMM
MIKNIYKKRSNFFIKILVIIMILSLIITGIMVKNFNEHSNKIVEVNGQKITNEQLQQSFQQERKLLQEYLGDRFSEVINNEENMNLLRNQVLDNLINNELIDQYAKKLNFTVSDKQIEKIIFAMPIFFKNNHFNSNKYREILNKYNINADDFAEQIRMNLIRTYFVKSFIGSDFVLPSEIKKYAKLFMQKREINTSILPFSNIKKKQIVLEEEIKTYYDKNKNFFVSPEQVKVNYIDINPKEIQKLTISDKDIKSYYKKNLNKYTFPEQKKYGLIQVSSKNEAIDIVNKLKNGENFALLALKKSTDKFTAKNNGIIGWMEADSTPNEIISANLTKKGQFSVPIKSQENYVIFSLVDIKPKKIKPLFTVKHLIKNILLEEKRIKIFNKLKYNISKSLYDDNKLLYLIKTNKLKFKTTNWFGRNTPPAELNITKVIKKIFDDKEINKQKSKNTRFDLIDIKNDNKIFIIHIIKRKHEYIKLLNEVKNEIYELIRIKKTNEELKKEGKKLLDAFKIGKGDVYLKKLNMFFTNKQIVSRLISQNAIINATMEMSPPVKNNPSYTVVRDEFENLVLIKLNKIILNEPTKYELKQLLTEYQKAMNFTINDIFMSNLRQNAKIKFFVNK